ncbi:hypothetical protein N9850_08600 [Granulosicoccus sp.]|nr:hypothetical protein [Granulosicoccus sp.]MDB4223819.1 hypothetical protein [Granulosicoccus sp.]
MSEYIKQLSKAIEVMHECRCEHFGTEHVQERHKGEIVWEGDVEIFELKDHPDAKIAYGWGWNADTGKADYIGILNVPPVESAVGAVKAAIISGQFG